MHVPFKNFNANFGVSLRVYKGQTIAYGDWTLAQLNKLSKKTELNSKAGSLKIRASMKVGEAEKIFKEHFGVNVQIADKAIKTIGKAFVPDSIKDLTNPAGYALKMAFHAASGIGNVISEFQESRADFAGAERQLNEFDCSIPEINAVKKELEAYDKTLQEIENKYIE